ncbi:MAG: acyl--CoA ligase [Gammaproteobacteria bacterium]|jgi:long-chain acyl-CoA synthetase|nr:acyl--CoA ligase [Gammaproteobacteria bacterium]MBT6557302.1 acyl--CoA ligase [Gammaproteobacteria bacterium]
MYQEYKDTWAELIAPGADFEIAVQEVRGVPIRTYANAAQNLRDLWLSTQAFADRDYLVYEDERITYAQAHEKVGSLAHWLIAQGVQPGDRVAIAMRNYPEWMLCYWATLSVGAAVVGMNAWWVGSEMLYALEDSTPKVMIVDPERLSQLGELRKEVSSLKLLGVRFPHEEAGVTPWADAIANPAPLPDIAIDTDDDACIFYTSGTTGKPKGAQLTHRGCVSNVWSMMFAGALQRTLAVKKGLMEADAEPVVPSSLVTTPLFHVTANNCVAHGTTLAGGKLTHMYKWDAGVALELIEKEKITAVSGVPVMAREIISHPNFATTDTSTLLTLGGGGAQLQPDLVGKIEDEVATARPNTGYGMTETCGIITSISADHFVDKPASCGPAMPAFESKVVNPDNGVEVPLGEAGELWVRGGHVIRGYLNREDATAETIVDGWLRTGDMAKKDEDDFIFIVDRIKDMVLRGGENIYCAEVESAIFDHEDVAECTVFGVADDRLGEEVGVALLLKPGATTTADELRGHCAGKLAKFKIPRYFWFMNEALPRNASGKFLKRELRDSLDVADSF